MIGSAPSRSARRAAAAALLLAVAVPAAAAPAGGGIAWQPWSADLFERAAREGRFVLLDMEAVWCHWCHVMDAQTYANPAVVEMVAAHYLPVRVDQDARPDLSSRYGDWGWPATIVFAPDGREIVKRRGFLPPATMLSMLQAIVDDPSPGPSVVTPPEVTPGPGRLDAAARARLERDLFAVYDPEQGGWGRVHKFIDADTLDYALARAQAGSALHEVMARHTLHQALNLLDPVWGGVYQYSDRPDWRSPHYEKLIPFQAVYLRAYALAYATWARPEHLAAARQIHGYLMAFMRDPETGAFYASQDADLGPQVDGGTYYALDDAGRRALGMPRIDPRTYARENGLVIGALAAFASVTGEAEPLERAVQAARWVIAERGTGTGGFRHGANDRAGPYLGDTLAMAGAFEALYTVTAEREWLARAAHALAFIEGALRHGGAGYLTAPAPAGAPGVLAEPVRRTEENVALARTALRVHHYTGDPRWREMAAHALAFLNSPAHLDGRLFRTGVLLADAEAGAEPVHVTVVGPKDDPRARRLHRAALALPAVYRRIEWWDRREGEMPNPDVRYPALERPAVFACAGGTCSLPVFAPADLPAAVARLRGTPPG